MAQLGLGGGNGRKVKENQGTISSVIVFVIALLIDLHCFPICKRKESKKLDYE